jgi:hypothetical protein
VCTENSIRQERGHCEVVIVGALAQILAFAQQKTTACPCRKLNPDILVVQSAQDWQGQNATDGLDGARHRRILVQRQVRASLIVVFCVRSKHMAKVQLAEYDNVVEAVPSDRADQPFRMSVLPWRSWGGRPIPNAHCPKTPDEDVAINAVPIANDVSRGLLPAECLGELTSDPFGTRMRGYTQP